MLPALGLALGYLAVSGRSHGGNMGSAIGAGLVLVLAVCAGAALGFAAAGVALLRGERWVLLSLLGFVANGAILVSVIGVLIKK